MDFDRYIENANKAVSERDARITALETALAAAKAEGEDRAKQIAELRAEGVSALAAMTAERDARDVAIGVLAKAYHAMDQYIAWQGDMQHADAMTRASLEMLANPLARAAVEGER